MNKDAMVAGVAGGVVGGIVFGFLMGMMGMLPMVAKLVGSSSAFIGLLVHLGISAVIGVGYGFLVSNRVVSVGPTLAAGTGYGALWWVLGPLTLMPLMLGMGLGVNWNLEAASKMLPSLFGHILFGLALAATYRNVGQRLGVLCRC